MFRGYYEKKISNEMSKYFELCPLCYHESMELHVDWAGGPDFIYCSHCEAKWHVYIDFNGNFKWVKLVQRNVEGKEGNLLQIKKTPEFWHLMASKNQTSKNDTSHKEVSKIKIVNASTGATRSETMLKEILTKYLNIENLFELSKKVLSRILPPLGAIVWFALGEKYAIPECFIIGYILEFVIISVVFYDFNFATIYRKGRYLRLLNMMVSVALLYSVRHFWIEAASAMREFDSFSFSSFREALNVLSPVILLLLVFSLGMGFVMAKSKVNWKANDTFSGRILKKLQKNHRPEQRMIYFWGLVEVDRITSDKYTLGTILGGIYFWLIFLFSGVNQISKVAFYTVVALFWVLHDIIFMTREGKIKNELFDDLTKIVVNPKFSVYFATFVMSIAIAVHSAWSCFDFISFISNYGLCAFFCAFGAFGLFPFLLLIYQGLLPLYLNLQLIRHSFSQPTKKEATMKIPPFSSIVVGIVCALISWFLLFMYIQNFSIHSYLFTVGVTVIISLSFLLAFLTVKYKFVAVSKVENSLVIFLHANFWLWLILFYAWNKVSFFGLLTLTMLYLIGVFGPYIFIWGETVGSQKRIGYFFLAIIDLGFAILLFLVGGILIVPGVLVLIQSLTNIAGLLYGRKGENTVAFYSGIFRSYKD